MSNTTMCSKPTMDRSDFTYPAVNLDIYAPNFTGKCGISFYERDEADEKLRIYIVDIEQPFGFHLTNEKVSPMTDLPPAGTVFAIDLDDDGFHRVVCNDDANKLFLIDCGEVIDVDDTQLKLFSLSNKAQKTSAKAIPCTVVQMLDEFGKQIDDIADISTLQIYFTVVQIKDNGLVVTLSKTPSTIEAAAASAESTTQRPNGMQLTQEQLDMLYDEPEIVTTNAMRAVYGYDPQDDRRLCQFYDPKTGACWKGNSCKFEHGPKLEDGWTTDRKTSTISLMNEVAPVVGSIVKVCVTHIRKADDFYVYIPELSAQFNPPSLSGLKNQMNTPEIGKQYKPCADKPNLLDLVLLKRENVFYRGKVVDYNEDDFVVHFLDYGYTMLVSRKNIYQWHPMWNLVPAQAHRCFLENVQVLKSKDEEATQAFRNLIFHTGEMSAKILSYNGDLIVRLYDATGVDIGETLCAYGLVELKSKIVPASTQVPG